MILYFTLTLLVCGWNTVTALTCLSCSKAAIISDCLTNTATCQTGTEECFLDKTLLPDLSTVYSAGCRAKAVCDIISSAGKRNVGLTRAKKSAVLCAQCCKDSPNSDGIPCNGYLCNQKPAVPSGLCAVCDRTANYSLCAETQQCPNNEVCQVKMIYSGGGVVYKLGCELKSFCDQYLKAYKETHVSPGGRRANGEIELCAACCDGRNCNKNSCQKLRQTQPCFNLSVCGRGR